jgi:hypothetical protein
MRCAYCNKRLGLFHLGRPPFCSEIHENSYYESQSKEAFLRLRNPFGDGAQPAQPPDTKVAHAPAAPAAVETASALLEREPAAVEATARLLEREPIPVEPRPIRPAAASSSYSDHDRFSESDDVSFDAPALHGLINQLVTGPLNGAATGVSFDPEFSFADTPRGFSFINRAAAESARVAAPGCIPPSLAPLSWAPLNAERAPCHDCGKSVPVSPLTPVVWFPQQPRTEHGQMGRARVQAILRPALRAHDGLEGCLEGQGRVFPPKLPAFASTREFRLLATGAIALHLRQPNPAWILKPVGAIGLGTLRAATAPLALACALVLAGGHVARWIAEAVRLEEDCFRPLPAPIEIFHIIPAALRSIGRGRLHRQTARVAFEAIRPQPHLIEEQIEDHIGGPMASLILFPASPPLALSNRELCLRASGAIALPLRHPNAAWILKPVGAIGLGTLSAASAPLAAAGALALAGGHAARWIAEAVRLEEEGLRPLPAPIEISNIIPAALRSIGHRRLHGRTACVAVEAIRPQPRSIEEQIEGPMPSVILFPARPRLASLVRELRLPESGAIILHEPPPDPAWRLTPIGAIRLGTLRAPEQAPASVLAPAVAHVARWVAARLEEDDLHPLPAPIEIFQVVPAVPSSTGDPRLHGWTARVAIEAVRLEPQFIEEQIDGPVPLAIPPSAGAMPAMIVPTRIREAPFFPSAYHFPSKYQSMGSTCDWEQSPPATLKLGLRAGSVSARAWWSSGPALADAGFAQSNARVRPPIATFESQPSAGLAPEVVAPGLRPGMRLAPIHSGTMVLVEPASPCAPKRSCALQVEIVPEIARPRLWPIPATAIIQPVGTVVAPVPRAYPRPPVPPAAEPQRFRSAMLMRLPRIQRATAVNALSRVAERPRWFEANPNCYIAGPAKPVPRHPLLRTPFLPARLSLVVRDRRSV